MAGNLGCEPGAIQVSDLVQGLMMGFLVGVTASAIYAFLAVYRSGPRGHILPPRVPRREETEKLWKP